MELDISGYENKVPSHTIGAMIRYLEEGYYPGSFLTAVLCNDLFKAIGHADSENLAALPDIVKLVYNQFPTGSWGSAAAMRNYVDSVWATKGLLTTED